MARYSKRFVVKAPPDRVYAGWLNAMNELVTLAPERFRSYKVLRHGDRERLTECVERWASRDLKYETKETLAPPSAAHQVVVRGHGKGSVTDWNFRPVSDGTQVDMELHLKGFEGFMLGVLMRKKFRQEMDETLDLWSRAIEQPLRASN